MGRGLEVQAAPVPINDTFGSKEWHLDAIQAREGWNSTTGSSDVIVAVIDSGVDIDHPDLKSNIWTNLDEIPNNGKDDDGDGYMDDIHGWSFVNANNNVRPMVSADGLEEAFIHGTVVASLIAAHGNNDIGISGVAWRARIMPLVVLGTDGAGRDTDIAKAIRYAIAHGADVINLSFVGYEKEESLAQVIREATSQGVLVVSAAGNGETIQGENLDLTAGFPACDKGAAGKGSITVTSVNAYGLKAPYANFGSCVDISAPGENLYAARPSYDMTDSKKLAPGYRGDLSGTSVAAPLVSGLAVLLKSAHPDWSSEEIAQRIIETAESVDEQNPGFAGKIGRGRINVAKALAEDISGAPKAPFFIEGADRGFAPHVRISDAAGKTIQEFSVGGAGDRRGLRTSFLHWTKGRLPEIAVTTIGDTSGKWSIYRWDGLLLAAGTVGSNVKGGLHIAAQDIDADGADELLFTEASGSRMWMLSAANQKPLEISPFAQKVQDGIAAVSVTRPRPAFLVSSKGSDRQIVIIGIGGAAIAQGPVEKGLKTTGWSVRRATRRGGGMAYEFISQKGKLVLINDGAGLSPTTAPVEITHWTQVPEGQVLHTGWRYYETWPR